MLLDPDGARLYAGAIPDDDLAALDLLLSGRAGRRPGVRLAPQVPLRPLIGSADAVAAALLGPAARAVRAILFDKSPDRNWALGWHQDRTVAVTARRDVPGFADWTLKSGIHHAVPPFAWLERMLTLRLHLDDVPPGNAPLRIVPGSHRLGRIAEPEIPAIVARLGTATCEAKRGDIWAYATPILHASDRARAPARRRVLQLLYSADDLPGALEWLGV